MYMFLYDIEKDKINIDEMPIFFCWLAGVISGFLVLCVVAAVIGGVTLLLFTIQHKHR